VGPPKIFFQTWSEPFDHRPRQRPPPWGRSANARWRVDGPRHQRKPSSSTATAATGIPGVVLRVAGGIIWIAAWIIRAAARLSRGIDCLVSVAAGEEKCCDHDRDAEPQGRFPTHWSQASWEFVSLLRRGTGHHALSVAGGGDLIEQRTLILNSMRLSEYEAAAMRITRGGM
jgi:hypothetical protein